MKVPDLSRLREEKAKWKDAGEPVRSDERVQEIYDNICSKCEHFIQIPLVKDRGQCAVCTCLLSKDADSMNKIRWATTKCPLTMEEHGEGPKWVEEIPPVEEDSPTPQPTPPPKGGRKGGCGCG